MSSEAIELQAVTQKWVESWSTRDARALLTLWDLDDDRAIYQPSERVEQFVGSNAVSRYIQNRCGAFRDIRYQPETPLYRQLTENIGSVFYTLKWMVMDESGPLGGTCRTTSLWRRTDQGWKIFHYAEAPVAPLLELQAFYEEVAADGLEAIPTRMKPS